MTMMKKLFFLILVFSIAAIAVVTDKTVDRRFLQIYLRSGNWNTGDRYTTTPVIVNGKVTCPYVGSIFAEPYDEFNCPVVNIYHLVLVRSAENGLTCYYDYTVGGSYMIILSNQKNCPDILAAYDGMKFFKGVYFDSVDDYRLYYRDTLLTQTFEGDFTKYPKVQEQIRYRRIHMSKDIKKREVIKFGN